MDNNINHLGRIRREEQRFFLNGGEVSGLQSISANYELNNVVIKHLGMDKSNYVKRGPKIANLSLNYLIITNDLFLPFTGDSGFNGYIFKRKDNSQGNYSFTSGYLTSYNTKCSIGGIPEVSVNVGIFGNVGGLNQNESAQVLSDFDKIQNSGITGGPLLIASPGTLELNIDDALTNRVRSYDLTIDIPRNAVYALGSRAPVSVTTNYPLEVTLNLDYEIDNYVFSNLKESECEKKTRDVSIILKDYNSKHPILNYSFTGMCLVSEGFSNSVDGNVSVSATYKAYLDKPKPEFKPYHVDELKLWLHADGLNYAQSGAILDWPDKTRFNHDVQQSTEVRKPLFVTGVLNSKPITRFTGASPSINRTDQSSLDLTLPITMFAVTKNLNETGVILSKGSTQSARFNYGFGIVGQNLQAFYNSPNFAVGPFVGTNSFKLLMVEQNSTGTVFGINGTLTSVNPTGGNLANVGTERLSVGCQAITIAGSSTRWHFSGDIAEILLYDKALSTEERQKVENYLNSQYNLY